MVYDNCEFRVYRNRKSENVFTLTLWRRKYGYIFNLATWWAEKFPFLFPDWNIRIYFDNSVFVGLHKDRTEWVDIFNQLLKHKQIELWFYNCPIAQDPSCIGCHKNTFGSLIRFHAFDDPETKIVVSHNLEYLTSPKDQERINKWIESGKKYHMYTAHNELFMYSCVGDAKKCESNNLRHKPSLMATFGINKNDDVSHINIFSEGLKLIKEKNRMLDDFTFGVDEIILTTILLPEIAVDNTFLSCIVLDYKDLPDTLKSTMLKLPKGIRKKYKIYEHAFFEMMMLNIDFAVEVITLLKASLEKYFVDKNIKYIELEEEIDSEIQKYLVTNFKQGKIHITFLYSDITSELKLPDNYLITYSILKNNLFYCIDFPGTCVKNKYFVTYDESYEDNDAVSDIFSKSFKTIFL